MLRQFSLGQLINLGRTFESITTLKLYRTSTFQCSVYILGLLGGDQGDLIPSGLTRSSEADTRGWGVKRARRVRDIWKKSKKNKRNASRRRKNKVEKV